MISCYVTDSPFNSRKAIKTIQSSFRNAVHKNILKQSSHINFSYSSSSRPKKPLTIKCQDSSASCCSSVLPQNFFFFWHHRQEIISLMKTSSHDCLPPKIAKWLAQIFWWHRRMADFLLLANIFGWSVNILSQASSPTANTFRLIFCAAFDFVMGKVFSPLLLWGWRSENEKLCHVYIVSRLARLAHPGDNEDDQIGI